jgi:hypothetical protein
LRLKLFKNGYLLIIVKIKSKKHLNEGKINEKEETFGRGVKRIGR